MKKTLSIFLALKFSFVFASTSIIGLTLGSTNAAQLKKVYPGADCSYKGRLCKIPRKEIKIDGLFSYASVVFNEKDKLQAVIILLNKSNSRFYKIKNILDGKYKLTYKSIPHVGNKDIIYKNGNNQIKLYAPHMDLYMTLSYGTDSFMKALNNYYKKQKN